ncbi:hypothetical protein RvY_12023 [Ramazzottius varieornatus]|uniref:Uncharacterized protein n=1 Tax=Ramazzottius varieornatus TaxID=947166 RepID=A0A1D1VKG2_RAMVA|nr:hypothetical protein RvY_12023 [Ramazzottius varieornatus]
MGAVRKTSDHGKNFASVPEETLATTRHTSYDYDDHEDLWGRPRNWTSAPPPLAPPRMTERTSIRLRADATNFASRSTLAHMVYEQLIVPGRSGRVVDDRATEARSAGVRVRRGFRGLSPLM